MPAAVQLVADKEENTDPAGNAAAERLVKFCCEIRRLFAPNQAG